MKTLNYKSIKTSKEYDGFLKDLYMGVKQKIEEVEIPPVKIISVSGNEPPASKQYQTAIACLYGIGYSLKMGLKFGKLPQPKGYFDYKVGALETLWWSIKGAEFDISNSKILRWKAYLMVPRFIDEKLFGEAVKMAALKKPEIPYAQASLEEFEEGYSIQVLNIGPYGKEMPMIESLHNYIKENRLKITGHHHEIYISDPKRVKPEKLKTVIRYPVK
ncbi:transcriptional regulator [Patescibacteria group bacterium]|nr:MAG: transcriptional regulator [Patescibacteria group bacterium]